MKRSSMLGFTSLLTIFFTLCLVTFTLLAISTAQSQERLSRASAQAVAAFYEGDTQAEAILAALRAGETPPGVTRQGNCYLYTCPISQHQQLEVEVELRDGSYRILRWQAVSTAQWEADENITVWSGPSQSQEEDAHE